MLSGPRALASASEASDYMLHEYLVRNDKAHRTANRWHGGGAEALGLPERVSRRRFVAVLEGHVPGTDIRLGRVVDGEHRHRPGWDCTFSAPKSVSLEALLHDNKAVMRAHDASVRAALDWMEAEFLQTRGYDPATGRRPRVKADGLVAATFRHVASRNNDPQLHTHAVIANMTRNAAGEWRSVEPTLLQRNRRLIGAWYRNDLARRLGEMGYVLVPTQVGGLPSFELAGYSPAMLEAFSTRRRDILDYIADKGWEYGAKTAQAATLHTRKRKDEPAPGELSAMWKARAEALGLARDADEVRLDRTERGFARPPARFTALEAVWQAVDHLEERHAVFSESDLLAAALGREPGRHTHVDLQAEIVRLREDGHLVAAGDGALTTRRTLRAEKEVVRRMREGKGTARPLAPEEAVAGRLAATELTEGQKEAVRLILRSPDPVVGVQGFAGTGKTRMLNEVAKLAGGRQVFGLAPSAAAARVLGVEGGIGVTTLQWLLTRYGSIAEGTATEEEIARASQTFRDAVVVVDESSMVGTVQMRDLQRILAPLGVARLVLVGDSLQLRPVAAGQPFRLLQRAGMATARMDDVIRQRSVDLKAAVEHMVAGDPALAVESIAADVRELPADALAGTAARLWLSLPPDARKGTVILAPTHERREEINAVVRRGLADEGVLGRRSVEIGRLVDRKLTRVHAADRESYRPGDVVVANRDVYGLREGEAWTVVGTGEDGVRLERRGECRAFAPSGNAARNLSLCESRPLPLRAGDKIVWTRNLRRRGLINGDRATVERIAGVRIDVRTHSGRALRFAVDDDDLRHIDHAWSSTVYRAQGLTRDNVIAVLDSASMMSDRAMLYVEMSRARDGFVLLTDDTEQLVSRLEREGETVSSALEAAGQAPWLEPDMAVTQKPALWPVLAEWRAHVQRAEDAGVLPFHLEGCDALMARMGALAEKDALPGALAEVLEEHRPFAEDRAMVSKWTSSMLEMAGRRERMLAEAAAAGTAVTSLPGHAAWSRRVERAVEESAELLADEDRYGVHLDRIAGARAQLGEPLDALGRALEFDGNAASLQSEWRARERGEGDAPLEDFAARIAALAREAAPGEMPPDLSRAADEIAERQREAEERQREAEERRRKEEERKLTERQARDAQSALEELARERTQLLHAAALEPVAKLADWQDWRDRAGPAMAEAAKLAEDAALGNGTREALAASAEELVRRLAVDREAAELHRDWYKHVRPLWGGPIHSFHAPESAALADRIAALEERIAQPLEMPGLLRMGLDDHRERAEEWSRIRECRADLARLAKRPEPGSEEWLRDARDAARAAAAILNDGLMCRAHGLTGTPIGEEFEGNAATLGRELRIQDALERLLRDWAEHAGAAAGEGLHPFHAPGYDALLARIRDHEREAGKRMSAPLAQVLEEHEALVRADREARKLAGRLDACLAKRDALLERAEKKLFSQQPVVELGWRYARWRREAGRAEEAGRELLGNDRYAAHLAALGGRAKIERAVERIERAAVLDHLPAEVVAACETLDDRVRETGRHRFFLPGHERACDLMSYSVQDGAAKAFVKNELAMREKMSDRAQLLDETKTLLEDCQQERDRAATDDLPFVRQENYGAWRYKAQLAVDNAKSMLADENKLAPFFKENPGLRQTLAAWRPLDRTMREEREDWERIKQERAEQKRLEQRRSRSQGISM